MKRYLMVLAAAVLSIWLFAGTALAAPTSQDPWEKLFGCDGYIQISCPGPFPW
jgi:hypothetical protein